MKKASCAVKAFMLMGHLINSITSPRSIFKIFALIERDSNRV